MLWRRILRVRDTKAWFHSCARFGNGFSSHGCLWVATCRQPDIPCNLNANSNAATKSHSNIPEQWPSIRASALVLFEITCLLFLFKITYWCIRSCIIFLIFPLPTATDSRRIKLRNITSEESVLWQSDCEAFVDRCSVLLYKAHFSWYHILSWLQAGAGH